MSENQWVVELMAIPVAFDEIYEMIKKDHPDIFNTWGRQKTIAPDNYGKDYPPTDFKSALERAITLLTKGDFAHMHVRVRNLETGEIIPGEALGA